MSANFEEAARKARQLEAMLAVISISSAGKDAPDGTLLSDYLGACWDMSRDLCGALKQDLGAMPA